MQLLNKKVFQRTRGGSPTKVTRTALNEDRSRRAEAAAKNKRNTPLRELANQFGISIWTAHRLCSAHSPGFSRSASYFVLGAITPQVDSEMAEEFESAKAIDGLMVYLPRPELAARITAAIRETATGILSGNIHSEVGERHHGDKRAVTYPRSEDKPWEDAHQELCR